MLYVSIWPSKVFVSWNYMQIKSFKQPGIRFLQRWSCALGKLWIHNASVHSALIGTRWNVCKNWYCVIGFSFTKRAAFSPGRWTMLKSKFQYLVANDAMSAEFIGISDLQIQTLIVYWRGIQLSTGLPLGFRVVLMQEQKWDWNVGVAWTIRGMDLSRTVTDHAQGTVVRRVVGHSRYLCIQQVLFSFFLMYNVPGCNLVE